MQTDLSGLQFFDEHLDPIDRELIRDRRRYPFVLLDLFDEFSALLTHGAISPLKGDQPRDQDLFAPIGQTLGVTAGRPGSVFSCRPHFSTACSRNTHQRPSQTAKGNLAPSKILERSDK
jgi:hypothetical protein